MGPKINIIQIVVLCFTSNIVEEINEIQYKTKTVILRTQVVGLKNLNEAIKLPTDYQLPQKKQNSFG